MSEDQDLKDVFARLRAADRDRAPTFSLVTQRAVAAMRTHSRPRLSWAWWLAGAGGLAALAAFLLPIVSPPPPSLAGSLPVLLPQSGGGAMLFAGIDPGASAAMPSDFLIPAGLSIDIP